MGKRWIWAVAAAVSLAGCGEKPPGCADPETISVATKMVTDDFHAKVMAEVNELPNASKPVLTRLLDEYRRALKVEMSLVVSNGYKSESQKQSCAGKLSVTTLTGKTVSASTDYDTQIAQDKKGSFVLHMANYRSVEQALYDDFTAYLPGAIQKEQAAATSPGPVVQPVSTNDAETYVKDNAAAQVRKDGDRLVFQLNSAVGDHSCQLKGHAAFVNPQRAHFASSDTDDKCQVDFSFSAGRLLINTEACSRWCGMQADGTMDGEYFRK